MSEMEELERKANSGDAEAAFQLGKAYAFGHGVELSLDKALFWLTNAAQVGHPTAALVLKDVGYMASDLDDKSDLTSNIKEKLVEESSVESDETNSSCSDGSSSLNSNTAGKSDNELVTGVLFGVGIAVVAFIRGCM